jgi:hypothetical protein
MALIWRMPPKEISWAKLVEAEPTKLPFIQRRPFWHGQEGTSWAFRL